MPAGLTRLDLSYTCVTNSGLLCLPCRLRRLGIEGCRVSVLGVAAVLRAHRGVVLWSPAAVHVPRWAGRGLLCLHACWWLHALL